MKASDIITRATDILQDAGNDYWSADELLRWLADGRNDAYKLRPDLYSSVETMTLTPGVTQTLPNSARWLFSLNRNVSHPRQRKITLVKDDDLSRVRPTWRSMKGATEIQHYLYDLRDPAHFDVFPPVAEDVQIELDYAKPPTAPATSDDLTQEGEYYTALIDYICYRAFLKECDTVPAFQARAEIHQQAFVALLSDTVQQKLATTEQS
jgi:hypothetical protein